MEKIAANEETIQSKVPSIEDIYHARQIVNEHLFKTPLTRSEYLSDAWNADVYLKREDTLPTGSFKIRGGINLSQNIENVEGLVTASTGNHGQSIACAGEILDIPVIIFVPEGSNEKKITAMERYGATVNEQGESLVESFEWAQEFASEQDYRFVHPGNESKLIAGVGTAGLEIIEELPNVDILLTPVGGGSSSSGYCLTVGDLLDADIIGVQAKGANAMYQAWKNDENRNIGKTSTFAEGIAVGSSFDLPLCILSERLTDMICVSDAKLLNGISNMLTREGILIEGAASAGITAGFKISHKLEGKTVVIPISGRNLSVPNLKKAVSQLDFQE